MIWSLTLQARSLATTSKQHGRGHRRGKDGCLVLKWKKRPDKLLETAQTCLLLFTLDPCCSANTLLDWLLSVAHHNWWSLDSGVVGSSHTGLWGDSYSGSSALTVFRANNRLQFVGQQDNPVGQPLWHKIIRLLQSLVRTGVFGRNTARLLLCIPHFTCIYLKLKYQ